MYCLNDSFDWRTQRVLEQYTVGNAEETQRVIGDQPQAQLDPACTVFRKEPDSHPVNRVPLSDCGVKLKQTLPKDPLTCFNVTAAHAPEDTKGFVWDMVPGFKFCQ